MPINFTVSRTNTTAGLREHDALNEVLRTDDVSLLGLEMKLNEQAWQVQVFYDGACPLCVREIKLLRWLDRKHNICFTDISAADFCASGYGKTPDQFMDEIHGRLPGISHALNFGYQVFAKNRLRLTGRCTKETCELK